MPRQASNAAPGDEGMEDDAPSQSVSRKRARSAEDDSEAVSGRKKARPTERTMANDAEDEDADPTAASGGAEHADGGGEGSSATNGEDEEEDGDGNGEDDDGDEEEAAEEEAPLERKVLPQRMTRGLRVGRLLGEAAEADQAFWGQAAFNEDDEGGDSEFDSSDAESSTTGTDSDIDAPEEEKGTGGGGGASSSYGVDGDGEQRGGRSRAGDVVDDSREGKARGKYVDSRADVGKALDLGAAISNLARAAKKKAAAAAAAEAAPAAATAPAVQHTSVTAAAAANDEEAAEDGEEDDEEEDDETYAPALRVKEAAVRGGQRSQRAASTKVAVGGYALLADASPVREKRPGGKRVQDRGHNKPRESRAFHSRMTQRQVLMDAAHTTIDNERALESVLRVESERQAREAAESARRGRGHAFPPNVAIVRFHSKRGAPDTLTFTCTDTFPDVVNAVRDGNEYPAPSVCAVTGKLGRYFDPVTECAYHDAAAFAVLRQRAAATARQKGAQGMTDAIVAGAAVAQRLTASM